MFVAVLTRRDKIESKDLWTGPDRVQNEIGIAHTLEKPIALFVEEKVQVDRSIVPYIADYVLFDRKKLDSIRNRAERFVKALRDGISPHVGSLPEEKVIDQTIVEEAEVDDAIVIVALGILPKYQNAGVGKSLIEKVEAEAKTLGKKKLLVSTSNDDLPALAFYQSLGFQIYEVKPNVIPEKHGMVLKRIGGLPVRDELRLQKLLQ